MNENWIVSILIQICHWYDMAHASKRKRTGLIKSMTWSILSSVMSTYRFPSSLLATRASKNWTHDDDVGDDGDHDQDDMLKRMIIACYSSLQKWVRQRKQPLDCFSRTMTRGAGSAQDGYHDYGDLGDDDQNLRNIEQYSDESNWKQVGEQTTSVGGGVHQDLVIMRRTLLVVMIAIYVIIKRGLYTLSGSKIRKIIVISKSKVVVNFQLTVVRKWTLSLNGAPQNSSLIST